MFKFMHTFIAVGLLCGVTNAQSTTRPRFFDRAQIQHSDSRITVVANDSTPLLQAIFALRLEYGWQVNWESAPGYSRFDTVDDTGPKWRAAHPNEKGVTRPAEGLFTASFPEPNGTSGSGAEHEALARLVEEYNATDNPGKYILHADSDGQFTIIGTRVRNETGALDDISPLLDTPVNLAKESRNIYDTIESILAALHTATGKKVLFAVASDSLFVNTQVTMGGKEVPARDLLKEALASTKRSLNYDLGFNPDVPIYILGVSTVIREEDDGVGGHKLIPVESLIRP